jgi:hypothetical protein
MPMKWPENLQPKSRVCHPVNTKGTTWLRESDLVFVKDRPYAVLHWSREQAGDVPDSWLELKSEALKRDAPDGIYRYEVPLDEPPQDLKR